MAEGRKFSKEECGIGRQQCCLPRFSLMEAVCVGQVGKAVEHLESLEGTSMVLRQEEEQKPAKQVEEIEETPASAE